MHINFKPNTEVEQHVNSIFGGIMILLYYCNYGIIYFDINGIIWPVNWKQSLSKASWVLRPSKKQNSLCIGRKWRDINDRTRYKVVGRISETNKS